MLIRYNYISPPEVEKLLDLIEVNLKDIDIFIYIFWQSVIMMSGVNRNTIKEEDYLKHLDSEYDQVKKLGMSHNTNKISANTDSIVYVFKAFLTPSGYLYNAPTP